VNTCFQPFESTNNSRFVFCRTDPLYLSQVVNFDITLSSTYYDVICLIECKSSLGKGLVNEVNELQKKISFVEKNNVVSVEGKEIRIKDYFAEKLNIEDPQFYYVLASEIVDLRVSSNKDSLFDSIVQVSEYPFDIWRCQLCKPGSRGVKITRNPVPSYNDREKCISIQDLTDYLDRIYSPTGNTIQICLSSNKYHLVAQSCINLKSFESFKFDDFLTSFSIDLKDYEEFEKKYLFEHFIDFGKECGVLRIVEDTEDTLTSSYAVINRRMKPKQLQKNIIAKMANQRIESDLEISKIIEEERQEIIQEIFYQKEPRQRKITEFTDKDK
jgi:hypothetical protein